VDKAHNDRLAAIDAALIALSERVSVLENENSALKERVATLEAELAATNRYVDQLHSTLTDVESKINLSNEQFNELERSLRAKLLEEGNKTISREEMLDARLNTLSDSLETFKVESNAKVSSARSTAWWLSIAATILGVLVHTPGY